MHGYGSERRKLPSKDPLKERIAAADKGGMKLSWRKFAKDRREAVTMLAAAAFGLGLAAVVDVVVL